MTLEYIAAIIESNYYQGRVQDNDTKMDRDDFLQMARAANGTIMRQMWYNENQQGNPNLYFADSIVTERFEITRKGRFRIARLDDGGAVKLPYASGIFRVSPAMTSEIPEGEDDFEDCGDYGSDAVYTRGEPGMEYTFGSASVLDDLGEAFYVPIGNTLRLFGFEEAKFIETDYIKNDEGLDVPEDVAWQILVAILPGVQKSALNLVDVTDDTNPNVTTFKKRIADPQGLDSQ